MKFQTFLESDKVKRKRKKIAGDCLLYGFIRNTPSKLEMQCKKGMFSLLNFGCYIIQLDIAH